MKAAAKTTTVERCSFSSPLARTIHFSATFHSVFWLLLLVLVVGVAERNSHAVRMECEEIIQDDSYSGDLCTFRRLNVNKNTRFEFVQSRIRIWWFIKRDLDFEDVRRVQIKNSSVDEVPRVLFKQFTNLEELRIEGAGMTEAHPLAFMIAQRLRKLFLAKNEFERLPRLMFYGAKVLETIDFSENRLVEVDKYAFINLECLSEIILTENRLLALDFRFIHNDRLHFVDASKNRMTRFTLHSETTSDLVRQHPFILRLNENELNEIDIQEHFPVTELYLETNALTGIAMLINLRSLEILNLAANPLNQLNLTTFFNLRNLKFLGLKSTGITGLNNAIFSRLNHLISLDISNNNLTELDWNVLAALGELEELAIFEYRLTKDDVEHLWMIFPRLKHIWISGKEWECGEFHTIAKHLQGRGINVNEGTGKFSNVTPESEQFCLNVLYL